MSSTKGGSYVTLNFDELNEKGLDKLKKAVTKGGYEVVKITPAGPARRKDGIPVKTFELKGMDEQVMTVQVNNTGDISGIKLNGKNAPYTPVKSLADLGKTLAGLFSRNSTAFQKALARKMAKAAQKDGDTGTPSPRKGVKSRVQLLSDAQSRRAELKQAVSDVTQKLATLSDEANQTQKEQADTQSQLNAELAKTSQLEAEIERLKGVKQ